MSFWIDSVWVNRLGGWENKSPDDQKTVQSFPKKLKIKLPVIPQSYSWAYIQKEENSNWKGYCTCTSVFIVALFTIVMTQKQPKCSSTGKWIKKMWYICTVEYYSVIKKNDIMPFAAICMVLEITILTLVSQRWTNVWYHLYVEPKKWYKWTYLQNRLIDFFYLNFKGSL